MKRRKIALLVAIVVIVGVYFSAGGEELLDPKAYQALYRQSPVATTLVFFLAYLAGTAFSLPVTGVLSVVAGIIFGHLVGIPMALFACTIGGTLAYLSSRYILHDVIQRRFATHLIGINSGVEKDGPFYLFGLRMIPVIPFWLLNLLMGLTRMKTAQFFIATLTGMVPITLVLVHFGTELGAIESFSLRAMFTPGLLFALALLGAMPFIAKGIVGLVKNRKLYPGGSGK